MNKLLGMLVVICITLGFWIYGGEDSSTALDADYGQGGFSLEAPSESSANQLGDSEASTGRPGRTASRTAVLIDAPEVEPTALKTSDSALGQVASVIGLLTVDSSWIQDHGGHHSITVNVHGDVLGPLSKFKPIQLEVRGDDLPVVGGVVSAAWTLEGLPVGLYRITYAGSIVQFVELRSGVNEVHAECLLPFSLHLTFVDETTGTPVEVSHAYWANYMGSALVALDFANDVSGKQVATRVGETLALEGVGSGFVALRIVAPGYEVHYELLDLGKGSSQVVSLKPVLTLVINYLEPSGERFTSYSNPTIAKQFAIVVSGEKHEPVMSGMNKEGLYAAFDFDGDPKGELEVLVPAGLEIVNLDRAAMSKGGKIYLEVR